MHIAGIIAEYNPFHKGHAWQIAETRRILGGCGIVCVMSGHWVQRGECALADKWTRAGAALRGGADLVLELPTPWAASSAETFARGGVEALTATGIVDVLSFGSETGDAAPLRRLAACLDTEDYREALRRRLESGASFAVCRHQAVEELLGPEAAAPLARPNNNLGVEYLRALPQGMDALAVKRAGAEHDGRPAGGFASASVLRCWLRQGETARAEPYLTEPWRDVPASMEWYERAALARLRTMTPEEAQALPDSGEGLAARLLAAGREAETLEEVYRLVKTKRYALSRIRRLVLWAALGLSAADRQEQVPYLRVLGFNDTGRRILRAMSRRAALPILTKPAHIRELDASARRLFQLEVRCTDLYGLCFPQPRRGGWEWRMGPVRELTSSE